MVQRTHQPFPEPAQQARSIPGGSVHEVDGTFKLDESVPPETGIDLP